jgi:hypothetical protein
MQSALEAGDWREFKLLLRFFACLQGILEGDGVFPVLDQLFDLAADQQAASQEDVRRNLSSLVISLTNQKCRLSVSN